MLKLAILVLLIIDVYCLISLICIISKKLEVVVINIIFYLAKTYTFFLKTLFRIQKNCLYKPVLNILIENIYDT